MPRQQPDDPLRPCGVNLNRAQRDEMHRLGGSAWLRRAIARERDLQALLVLAQEMRTGSARDQSALTRRFDAVLERVLAPEGL